jgi:hypothetical protein
MFVRGQFFKKFDTRRASVLHALKWERFDRQKGRMGENVRNDSWRFT